MMNGGLCCLRLDDLQASMADCDWFLHQLANLAKQGTA